jgi:Cu-Zn family superoxide dismutase
MRKRIILLVPTALIVPLLAAAADRPAKETAGARGTVTAKAGIKNATGQDVGSADFTETPAGVLVHLKVHGLPAGSHGLHIHEYGKCEAPDFKSAGGHFNPTSKKHGFEDPNGPHAGDLPNLIVGQDGNAEVEMLAAGLSLSHGQKSLLRQGGTALIVHAQVDDYHTDPAGSAGDRLACGVIQREDAKISRAADSSPTTAK